MEREQRYPCDICGEVAYISQLHTRIIDMVNDWRKVILVCGACLEKEEFGDYKMVLENA